MVYSGDVLDATDPQQVNKISDEWWNQSVESHIGVYIIYYLCH